MWHRYPARGSTTKPTYTQSVSTFTAPPQLTDPPVDGPPLKTRRHTWLRDALEIAGIALVLYIVIWNAFETVRVDGQSMNNTLGDQDLLFASKISYALHAPERGDIVILIPPIDPNQDFIKRVIAIPGDKLMIDSGGGTPIVEIKPGGAGPWQRLNEPYLREAWDPSNNGFCCQSNGYAANDGAPHEVTVPNNDFFVMGDNRNHSTDSRVFGFVARDKIIAKAFVRIWPFLHFGLGTANTLVPASVGLGGIPLFWLWRKRLPFRSKGKRQ